MSYYFCNYEFEITSPGLSTIDLCCFSEDESPFTRCNYFSLIVVSHFQSILHQDLYCCYPKRLQWTTLMFGHEQKKDKYFIFP